LAEPIANTLRKLLSSTPPCSYSFAASELLRRHDFTIIAPPSVDGLCVRVWHRSALARSPADRFVDGRFKTSANFGPAIARSRGNASPHRWFPGQERQPSLLGLIDDNSRLISGARIYERENLPAHLDFFPAAFRQHGLPLALYVDYHSFFFTSRPDALTQLGAALRFYEVSLRYASTPQAKGKIERSHDFWQKRLPALFAAEQISTLSEANAMLEKLRHHHNSKEIHRELSSTPQAAWNLALKENRSSLRPVPICPW
jgi:hypothetical protein